MAEETGLLPRPERHKEHIGGWSVANLRQGWYKITDKGEGTSE